MRLIKYIKQIIYYYDYAIAYKISEWETAKNNVNDKTILIYIFFSLYMVHKTTQKRQELIWARQCIPQKKRENNFFDENNVDMADNVILFCFIFFLFFIGTTPCNHYIRKDGLVVVVRTQLHIYCGTVRCCTLENYW